MLLAALLRLVADRPGQPWPDDPQRQLQGWLYDGVLASVAPQMAEAVHDWRKPGPITLAALGGDEADGHATLTVRVTVLDSLIAEVLWARLEELWEAGETIRIGPTIGRLDGLTRSRDDHPLAGTVEETALLSAPALRRWSFRFHTPTTFKTGDVDQPLPVPRSLWGSWLRRWNDFLPETIDPALLDGFDRGIGLEHLRIETADVVARGRAVGFTGDVTVATMRRVDDAVLVDLTRLAAFSFWAGTGRQTLLGMGVTEPRVG